MMTVKYAIRCDGSIWAAGKLHACMHSFSSDTEKEARREAMERGWEHSLERDYCKPCASAQRHEKAEAT